jgi:TolB-like protein
MQKLLAELKRRQMFRVAAAYAVVAWLILQVVNTVAPGLNLPIWVVSSVIVLLAIGFPVALLFCWIQQLAPVGEQPAHVKTNKLDWILAGGLAAVIALILYQQLAPSPGTGTAQQAAVAPSNPAPQSGAISIAVLPFANLSGDAGQEFFSDGITEEINGALAKVPNLQIVARTSAFQFKGQNRDIQTIGQQLHATHLIEGSVRKAGDQLRITAQLVRADNGLQLWSETYDRQLTNIFAIQEDIAQAIAGALKVPLGLQQGESLVLNRTDDLESYQQYLRARALYRGREIAEAIRILEPVVAGDPEYAPGWALLAQSYGLVPFYENGAILQSLSVEEARRLAQSFTDKAENAAREAVRLEPRYAAGLAALGYVQAQRNRPTAAEDLFKQALALDRNDPDTLHIYSIMLSDLGLLRASLQMRERLRTLEPFVPIYSATTALVMQLNGQSAASIPILESIPSDAAGGFYRNVRLAKAYATQRRFADAADTLLLIEGNQVTRSSVEDAARLIRTAPATTSSPGTLPVLSSDLNFVYFHVGALPRVMENPERQLEVSSSFANARNLWFPEYAPLRKTERFKAFVRTAGFVDYWRERGWPDLCRPVGADDFTCD